MDVTDHLQPIQMDKKKSKLTAHALAQHMGAGEEKHHKDGNEDYDSDSALSEIDDTVFNSIAPVNDRPVIAIDEDTVNKLGVHRRKRDPNEVANDAPIKKTSRLHKRRRRTDGEEKQDLGRPVAGKGDRRAATKPDRPVRILSAEEQRVADLDAKISDALKPKTKRRKRKDEQDLEQFQDDMIINLRDRMISAAEKDNADVKNGQAATHKIRMLDEVRGVIGKPNLVVSCMDNSFLSAVRRWLEPLDNKALPAYTIQKELFHYLRSLNNPDSEVLRESGIGKIVAFYTKDARPQPDIKRNADSLIRDWARPILGRSDDYKTRQYVTREYDPSLEFGNNQTRDEDENNPLALPQRNPNRTRVPMSMPRSYEIVPKSMVTPGGARAYSSQADELVKRVKARAQAQKKGGKKSGLSIEGRGLY